MLQTVGCLYWQKGGGNLPAERIEHTEEGMELEDKAKVVASVWGAECVQFLSPLAVLPRLI